MATKASVILPLQLPAWPSEPWELVFKGEVVGPPNKTWAGVFTPQHTQANIHHISWRPLHQLQMSWIRWLFACVIAEGYDYPTSFWKFPPPPSKTTCKACKGRHNMSVHGHLAFCTDHPLQLAWFEAWGPLAHEARGWVATATLRDKFLVGKVVIPTSLYLYLVGAVGRDEARRGIVQFQGKILGLLCAVLPKIQPLHSRPSKRPNPYHQEDWDCRHELKSRIRKKPRLGGR